MLDERRNSATIDTEMAISRTSAVQACLGPKYEIQRSPQNI